MKPFAVLLLVTLCIALVSCDIKFDKREWLKSDVGVYYNRAKMVDDLVKNYDLVGMKYQKVIELLGKPDDYRGRSLYYVIELDFGSDIDPVYGKDMLLAMSPDSTITKLTFEEWGEK